MAKYAKKNAKQCTLDAWRQKTPERQIQGVSMASKCSQNKEADDALKKIFGHEAYKSDVQQKAVAAILTGFQLLVWILPLYLICQINASVKYWNLFYVSRLFLVSAETYNYL